MKTDIKSIYLILTDFFSFWVSLFLALFLRHLPNFKLELLKDHLLPFSFIFFVWLLIFFIFDLYSFRKTSILAEYSKNYLNALLIALFITIALFYLLPLFKIAPKTLLVLFTLIFIPLNLETRNSLLSHLSKKEEKKIAFVGKKEDFGEIENFLNQREFLSIKEVNFFSSLSELKNNFDLLVVSDSFLEKSEKTLISEKIKEGKTIISLSKFSQDFLGKVPLSEINEKWLIENLFSKSDLYDYLKRFIDILVSSIVGLLSLPLWPIIAIGIKLSSPGPIFFKDKRVGKNEKVFILYKFRTLHEAHYKKPEEGVFGVKEGDK